MGEPNIPSYSGNQRRRTRTYDADTTNTGDVLEQVLDMLCPAGTLIATVLTEEPEGDVWKFMNGQWLSKSDFPRLYNILKGNVDETSSQFQLPDLTDKAMIGAGGLANLLQSIGLAESQITVANLPPHGHGVTDNGHDHDTTQQPHGHETTEEPHDHGVTDPGHFHTGVLERGAQEVNAGTNRFNITDANTDSATTGITIDEATTDLEVDDATIDLTVNSATTGISINETGGGEAFSVIQPSVGVNIMVRT